MKKYIVAIMYALCVGSLMSCITDSKDTDVLSSEGSLTSSSVLLSSSIISENFSSSLLLSSSTQEPSSSSSVTLSSVAVLSSSSEIPSSSSVAISSSATVALSDSILQLRIGHYTYGGMDYYTMLIENRDSIAHGNLQLVFDFTDRAGLDTSLGMRLDIGQTYDANGFNSPISANVILALTNNLRNKFPVVLSGSGSATLYRMLFPLDSITIPAGGKMRLDFALDSRSPWSPHLDLMNANPGVTFGVGDYSFGMHSISNGDPENYSGIPEVSKDIFDTTPSTVPVNHYIAIYEQGVLQVGYPAP